MKFYIYAFICIIFITSTAIGFLGFQSSIFAQQTENKPPEDIKSEYDKVKDEIAQYEKEIANLQSKEVSLSNQIKQFETQTSLTLLQIQKTQSEIDQLQDEIIKLQFQVDGLEISLEKLSHDLAQRVVEKYQRGEVTTLKLLASSEGFGSLVTKYAYAEFLQAHERQALISLRKSQVDVEEIKIQRETKQKEVEKKRVDLEKLKATLELQKKAKEKVLEVTKNDEVKFKQLLEAARSKEQQLAKLIFRDGKVSYSMAIYNLSKRGAVTKGSRIGTMGNSGAPRCSTAAHLHFEVLENARITDDSIDGDLINPLSYLKSKEVSYFTSSNIIDVRSFGVGSWDWPLSNPVITQEFGKTPWSQRYTSGFHTGIDMVDYNNYAINAPEGGTLYYAKIACGNPINIAIVEHSGATVSMYLHLQ